MPKPNGEITLQTIAMPADTNANGDIFGGWIVSQMDLACGIFAKALAKGRVVTVAINSMVFLQPVQVGDVISCYARLQKHGKTSMTIDMEVWVNCHLPAKQKKVTDGSFVFVAIDDNGKPRAIEAKP